MSKYKSSDSFTLIEVLIVVALIAVLAAITIVAINPAKNFADARNTQRTVDVQVILDAITQYIADGSHNVNDFGAIPLCSAPHKAIGTGSGNLNLAPFLVDTYLVDIPHDPLTGNASDTRYRICLTTGTNQRIQIDSADPENGKIIGVMR